MSGSTPTNSKAWPIGPRSRTGCVPQPATRIAEDDDVAALEVGDLLHDDLVADQQGALHRRRRDGEHLPDEEPEQRTDDQRPRDNDHELTRDGAYLMQCRRFVRTTSSVSSAAASSASGSSARLRAPDSVFVNVSSFTGGGDVSPRGEIIRILRMTDTKRYWEKCIRTDRSNLICDDRDSSGSAPPAPRTGHRPHRQGDSQRRRPRDLLGHGCRHLAAPLRKTGVIPIPR